MWAPRVRSGKRKRKGKRKGFKGVNGLKGNSGRLISPTSSAWQAGSENGSRERISGLGRLVRLVDWQAGSDPQLDWRAGSGESGLAQVSSRDWTGGIWRPVFIFFFSFSFSPPSLFLSLIDPAHAFERSAPTDKRAPLVGLPLLVSFSSLARRRGIGGGRRRSAQAWLFVVLGKARPRRGWATMAGVRARRRPVARLGRPKAEQSKAAWQA